MSNRSLMEFNHDFGYAIKADPEDFIRTINSFLNSTDEETAARLRLRYGIRIFGTRHHSDAFDIDWGGQKSAEGKS